MNETKKLRPWNTVLAWIRVQRGYTMTELSNLLEEPKALVSAIEGGTKACPLRVAFKFSDLVKASPSQLFDDMGFAQRFDECAWAFERWTA